MADKFKKGDIVEFKIGTHKLSGTVMKVYHSRGKKVKWDTNVYLVMTDYEIVNESDTFRNRYF